MKKVTWLRGIQAAEKAAREGYAIGLKEDKLTDDDLEAMRVAANENAALIAFSRDKVAPVQIKKQVRTVEYVYREPVEIVPKPKPEPVDFELLDVVQ